MEEKIVDASRWGQKAVTKTIMPANPELKVARAVAKKAAIIQYGYEELLNHVANRLKQFDILKERDSNFAGRLMNKVSGADTEKVELDGIVLQQLMTLAGEELPIEIKLGSTYKIKHAAIRSMFEKAKSDPDQSEYDRLKGYDWRSE